jgi:DNA-binding PadR family transcriptional regulator
MMRKRQTADSRNSPRQAQGKSLSLPVIHILLALADGAKHGYAIKQDVEERTSGTIRLGPGTLYEAIQRLQESGLIEESAGIDEEPANGQQAQRRYYALTPGGWDVLRDEVRQLGAVVERARANPKLRKGLV